VVRHLDPHLGGLTCGSPSCGGTRSSRCRASG
jgi:hypothetical protein